MKKLIITVFVFVTLMNLAALDLLTISAPTANVPEKGEYNFTTKFYGQNSFRIGANIGLFERLMLGFSYGASEFVGSEDFDWNDHVDFKAKFQILKETVNIPGLSIGFDSEGHGIWNDDLSRYAIKSKGFYAVIGKKDIFLRGFEIQAGANKSMEDDDGDKDINAFIGLSQSIGEDLKFSLEYDCAFNDNSDEPTNELDRLGEGRGYLNFSAGWYIIPELQFKFTLHDMMNNSPELNNGDNSSYDRSFEIIYSTNF